MRVKMGNWESFLKADPTEWLLGVDNPSVRYIALTDILDIPENDPEARKANQEIMISGTVPKILSKQHDNGYWDDPEKFYTAKYKGTVWQLIILAELGADGNDNRIKKTCEFILKNSYDPKSGGFSMHYGSKTGGGRQSEVIPCLSSNMVWSLIRLGYLKDGRVQKGIDWITKYQRFDDGTGSIPKDWPYYKAEACFGKHSCHMGVVKALKALAEIPRGERSKDVQNTLNNGAEFMLKHHIYRRSHDLSKVSKPGWLRFGFPLMYQTDILEILGIFTMLGYKDKRMQEAVDAVVKRQDEKGRWELKSTFNGRFITNIERKGEPSKWITLNALKVLKNYYG